METRQYIEYHTDFPEYEENSKGDFIEVLSCTPTELPTIGTLRCIRGKLYYRFSVAIEDVITFAIFKSHMYNFRIQWRKYEPQS